MSAVEDGSGDVKKAKEAIAKAKSSLERIFGDISKRSASQQLVVGGTAGVFSGYIFAKVGRAAALIIGGSVLVSQFAIHNNYITVNWKKVDEMKNKVGKTVSDKDVDKWINKGRDFFDKNRVFVCTFLGGFLVGSSVA